MRAGIIFLAKFGQKIMETLPADQTPSGRHSRPTLLTVLCILTFIGGAFSLLGNVKNYLQPDIDTAAVTKVLDSAKQELTDKGGENLPGAIVVEKVMSGAAEMMDNQKLKRSSLISILSNLLILGGAFLMFQMKKVGFWVFLAGVGVSIAGPLMVFGTSNLLGLFMTMGSAFIGILFAVLYSLNLKKMS